MIYKLVTNAAAVIATPDVNIQNINSNHPLRYFFTLLLRNFLFVLPIKSIGIE